MIKEHVSPCHKSIEYVGTDFKRYGLSIPPHMINLSHVFVHVCVPYFVQLSNLKLHCLWKLHANMYVTLMQINATI